MVKNPSCISVLLDMYLIIWCRSFSHGKQRLLGDSALRAFHSFILPEEICTRRLFLIFAKSTRILDEFQIVVICRAVKNSYRFTQLGVGWVLRDVSVHHPQQVVDFLNEHESLFIKEGRRYATEKMKPKDKQNVNYFKKKYPVSPIQTNIKVNK